MLTKIRLRNFKAFKDTGDVEIAPLTVLTGPNSSGKSAILRAMMALRQTAEGRGAEFEPVGDYVDLGRYEDFAFRHDVKAPVGFDLAFGGPGEGVDFPVSVELEYRKSTDSILLAKSAGSPSLTDDCISRELAGVNCVGPFRGRPQRKYLAANGAPGAVGIDGEFGPAMLWSASVGDGQLDSARLSEWCSRMGLALEVKLVPCPGRLLPGLDGGRAYRNCP